MRSSYAVARNPDTHHKSAVTLIATSMVGDEVPTVASLISPDRNPAVDHLDIVKIIELENNREPYGVAVSPDGTRVYVTTLFSGTVEVIDTATDTVVASVHVGGYTTGVSVTADGKCLYIGESHGHVYAMNTSTYALTTVIESANYPGKDVAVTPDGRYVYALDNVFNEILVIKARTHAVTATIALDQTPQSITIAQKSGLAYVGTDVASNSPAGSVTVIDTAIHMVVDTVTLADGVRSVFLTSEENHVYAVTDTTTVTIDTATNLVVNASPPNSTLSGKCPESVATTPDGRYAYIANWSGGPATVLTRAPLPLQNWATATGR